MTPDESQEAAVSAHDESQIHDATESDQHLDQDHADGEDELKQSADADLQAAKDAWDKESIEPAGDDPRADEAPFDTAETVRSDLETDEKVTELAEPFVGRWTRLISTTNWEKGRIISEWRAALIDSGLDATQYSDDAWATRVGGVTAPHVGRLRRVYDRFGSTYATYDDIYWSHFLAALDWEDAPMWLEGASRESWSVSQMREQRWQAHGAVESQRPSDSQIVEVETDEDMVLPAQGGGSSKQYGDEPANVAAGPSPEGPDFGDEEELMSMEGSQGPSNRSGVATEDPSAEENVQPFIGLPELPQDLSDAVEAMKLSILRHKTSGWKEVDPQTVQKYLDAIGVLVKL